VAAVFKVLSPRSGYVRVMSSLVVYSTAGKHISLPPLAHAILGEYVEDGTNHGRKVYSRLPNHEQEGAEGGALLLGCS